MWWDFLLLYYATSFCLCGISSSKSPILCMALSRKAIANFQNHMYLRISIHKQPCPILLNMGSHLVGVLARAVAFNNERKKKWEFRESAGLELRGRKMNVAGQVKETQMELGVPCIYGRVKEAGLGRGTIWVLMQPQQKLQPASWWSSGAGLALQSCPQLGQRGQAFKLLYTNHQPGCPRELGCGLGLGRHWYGGSVVS